MEGGNGANGTGVDEETAFWDKLEHLDREDREEHYRVRAWGVWGERETLFMPIAISP